MSVIVKLLHRVILLLFVPWKSKFNFIYYFFQSNSQLSQDIFVLSMLDFKKNGFFVEFGACDGLYLSNTLILETKFKWNGILSEPLITWSDEIIKNRNVNIDFRCVWKKSNEELEFIESANDIGLSTISSFKNSDKHHSKRRNATSHKVKTVTLNDLLDFHNSPNEIDFLSIDTEGSEFDILKNFNFSKYNIKVICVEHNYGANRDKIYKLLTSKGYIRKFKFISRFDDWYIYNDI